MLQVVREPSSPTVARQTEAEQMLGFAGPVTGLDALIVGAPGPALLCALLRAECGSALSVRHPGKLGERNHDLVLAPCLADAATGQLVHFAAWALAPTGRLVARVEGTARGAACASLTGALRQAGFVAIRTQATPGGTLVRADVPMFGHAQACARPRCAA